MSSQLKEFDFFQGMDRGFQTQTPCMTVDMDELDESMFQLACGLAYHNSKFTNKAMYRFSSNANPMDSDKIRIHFKIPVSSYDSTYREYLNDDPNRLRLDDARGCKEKLFQVKNGKSVGAWLEVDYNLVDYLNQLRCVPCPERT